MCDSSRVNVSTEIIVNVTIFRALEKMIWSAQVRDQNRSIGFAMFI